MNSTILYAQAYFFFDNKGSSPEMISHAASGTLWVSQSSWGDSLRDFNLQTILFFPPSLEWLNNFS